MSHLFKQILLFVPSLFIISHNHPDSMIVPFPNEVLRLYATGVDVGFHSGTYESSFVARKGIGFSYQHINGDLYMYCVGECKYTRGVTRNTAVEFSIFRGNLVAEGIQSLSGDIAQGGVEVYDIDNTDIQIGNGDVKGTLFSQSNTNIRVLNGDVNLQLPIGAWHLELAAPLVESDLPMLDGEESNSDGQISVFVHNGSCRLDSLASVADEQLY